MLFLIKSESCHSYTNRIDVIFDVQKQFKVYHSVKKLLKVDNSWYLMCHFWHIFFIHIALKKLQIHFENVKKFFWIFLKISIKFLSNKMIKQLSIHALLKNQLQYKHTKQKLYSTEIGHNYIKLYINIYTVAKLAIQSI